jgi:VWFA-related protein
VKAAQSADTAVYTIQYPTRRAFIVVLDPTARMDLRRVASDTGGRFYNDPKGIPGRIFEEISADLGSMYVLTFSLPDAAQDGKFHKLEVRSKRSGTTVSARTRYLAGR